VLKWFWEESRRGSKLARDKSFVWGDPSAGRSNEASCGADAASESIGCDVSSIDGAAGGVICDSRGVARVGFGGVFCESMRTEAPMILNWVSPGLSPAEIALFVVGWFECADSVVPILLKSTELFRRTVGCGHADDPH
jgi:hypothetical protein